MLLSENNKHCYCTERTQKSYTKPARLCERARSGACVHVAQRIYNIHVAERRYARPRSRRVSGTNFTLNTSVLFQVSVCSPAEHLTGGRGFVVAPRGKHAPANTNLWTAHAQPPADLKCSHSVLSVAYSA